MTKIKKVLFMGSKRLGLRVLREIHSISPETLIGALTIDDGHDTRTVLKDFAAFCNASKLSLYIASNRKHSEEIIQSLQPDLCLVVGWYWLITERVLNTVPNGFIGIHNSLLPKYRGGSPLIWPIINDEKEVGFSFFSFTPGVDDGAIWAQGNIAVEENDYISDVLKKLEDKTIEVLRDKYPLILNGDVSPVEQRHEEATYCAQRFPNDGNIDWHKSARCIYNFIRAQSDPYPGAFTYLEVQVLKIWKARLFKHKYYGTPGQVARVSGEGVYVICGDNHAVILEEVEIGERRGKADEFVKSIRSRLSNIIGKGLSDATLTGS